MKGRIPGVNVEKNEYRTDSPKWESLVYSFLIVGLKVKLCLFPGSFINQYILYYFMRFWKNKNGDIKHGTGPHLNYLSQKLMNKH